MVNFKAIYIIFQGFRGYLTFSRGVQLFPGGGGGSNCLFPIETHKTCDFPGGYGPPAPPLWIRTCGFRLFPQATILIHRRLTCISFLTGLYLECGYEICDVSVIKRTCPKGNQFEFPLPFPKRVKKKQNITFRTLHSEKNINYAMLILIFVHDIYAQEFK